LLWSRFERSLSELDFLDWFILRIVPGKPKVSVEQPKDAVIVLWILEEKNGAIKDYHVTYIREDDSSDKKSRTTQESELQFDNLMAGKSYEFQVGTIGTRSLGKQCQQLGVSKLRKKENKRAKHKRFQLKHFCRFSSGICSEQHR